MPSSQPTKINTEREQPLVHERVAGHEKPKSAKSSERAAKSLTSKLLKMKRSRAKKPANAPTRPKSAYMFFLADFRARFKEEHPEVRKVAEVALVAGKAWRALEPANRKQFEDLSRESKAVYAERLCEYLKENPKLPRKRPHNHVPRPMSPYFCFLAEFRIGYKVEHGATSVKEVGRAAGEEWNKMTDEQRAPYHTLSLQSRAAYRDQKDRVRQTEEAEAAQNVEDIQPEAENVHHLTSTPLTGRLDLSSSEASSILTGRGSSPVLQPGLVRQVAGLLPPCGAGTVLGIPFPVTCGKSSPAGSLQLHARALGRASAD